MDRLKQIIADILGIKLEEIQPKLSPENCKVWDSFNHILIISEIEKQLHIVIPIEEASSIKTYHDLEEKVNKQMKGDHD